ncbi:MAG: nucleotidyltransferase domain-containing protein [Verrucomicrobiota bacterium]
MKRRLDLNRWGWPFDCLRRGGRNGRQQCGDDVVDGLLKEPGSLFEDRVVHVPRRAAVDSEYSKVFAGVDAFPSLSVYIHGSWADGTMTPFSDYDDLIIVDYSRIDGEDELRAIEAFLGKVDMYFCSMDPLQHHGHWLVDRENLMGLDESYLPLMVLKNAVCVQGEMQVAYRTDVSRSRAGFRRNVEVTCRNIESWRSPYLAGRISLYDMKCLLGSFMILPAYVFQASGEMVSKPEGIGRALEIFSTDSLGILQQCTNMRQEWHRVLAGWRHSLWRAGGALIRNPNMHRRYARQLSVSLPRGVFPVMPEAAINRFLKEARAHANLG